MKIRKPGPGIWRGLACGAMAAVMVGSILATSFGTADFERAVADNDSHITELQRQVSDLEDNVMPDAATLNKNLYSASDAGNKVAEYQDKYQDMDPEVVPDDITANAQTLSEYFTDDAQSGRTPWFTVSKGDAHVDWQFKSTYSFQDEKMPVIWLCYIEGSDEVVAYTTANFDAESGKFSDVETHNLGTASKYIDATGESQGALNSLIESIQSQDDGEGGKSDGELNSQDQSDAHAWLQQQEGGDE